MRSEWHRNTLRKTHEKCAKRVFSGFSQGTLRVKFILTFGKNQAAGEDILLK
jgi:hypothetical protein